MTEVKCDHCHKIIDKSEHRYMISIDCVNDDTYDDKIFDLCSDCINKLMLFANKLSKTQKKLISLQQKFEGD